MKATEFKNQNDLSSNRPLGEIVDAGKDALNSSKNFVEGFAPDYSKKMQEGLNTVKEKLKASSSDVNTWVKANPLAAVGIAVGAGLLIGKLFISSKKE